MRNLVIRRYDAFTRVIHLLENDPLPTPIPVVGELVDSLQTIADALLAAAAEQDIGRGGFRAGAAYRQLVAEQLRVLMRPVAKMARVLKPADFPGVREQLRMPSGASYMKLIARAEAFATAIAPIRQEFVNRGLPGNLDTEIALKAAELLGATAQKNAGRATQMEGTANLMAKSSEGMDILRELDAILGYQYRNDPGQLAAWNGARRIERSRKSASELPSSESPSPVMSPASTFVQTAPSSSRLEDNSGFLCGHAQPLPLPVSADNRTSIRPDPSRRVVREELAMRSPKSHVRHALTEAQEPCGQPSVSRERQMTSRQHESRGKTRT